MRNSDWTIQLRHPKCRFLFPYLVYLAKDVKANNCGIPFNASKREREREREVKKSASVLGVKIFQLLFLLIDNSLNLLMMCVKMGKYIWSPVLSCDPHFLSSMPQAFAPTAM